MDRDVGPGSSADPFAQELGVVARSVEVGRAVVSLEVERRHCNDLGNVHGGALFSLADVALSVASNARPGELAVAITGAIHFLVPARPGDVLVAEAVEERRGGRLGSYAISISRDGEMVATALATTILVGERSAPAVS